MELVYQCRDSGLKAILIRGLGSERDQAEREVLEAGVPLALPYRAVWAEHLHRRESWFLIVRDQNGRACAGVAIERSRTRALPGHAILCMGKFGGSLPLEVSRVVLQTFALLVRKDPWILRSFVSVFSRDRRDAIGELLKELGFREVLPPNAYRYTLVIDLKPSEDEIFAALGKSARKRIRETLKMSFRSIVISDPVYADRLKELQQQALRRTGGHSSPQNWPGILRMSNEHPNLSRVFGFFLGENTSPEEMAAFGWVCNHGDHGEYRSGGSKSGGEVRISLSSLLLWDMIRWAKAAGAEWFDMGGVTLADGDEPELEGISNFKRYFSREVVEVGAEWVLEPHPVRAGIATLVSGGAEHVRKLMKTRA